MKGVFHKSVHHPDPSCARKRSKEEHNDTSAVKEADEDSGGESDVKREDTKEETEEREAEALEVRDIKYGLEKLVYH